LTEYQPEKVAKYPVCTYIKHTKTYRKSENAASMASKQILGSKPINIELYMGWTTTVPLETGSISLQWAGSPRTGRAEPAERP
jgi:hypothetical protein